MKIVVVEYGMGNVGSVKNMFKKAGQAAEISSDPEVIAGATHLVLPGVGAFDHGMRNLQESRLIDVLEQKVKCDKIPILGICLGMQLLTNRSEEGDLDGLGWVDAETCRFRFDDIEQYGGLKIPHMGWNEVRAKDGEFLYEGYAEVPKYYFVHSYHVCCKDSDHCISTTIHGYEFTSSIRCGNIFGVQFHPEKSHRFGLKLLKNFIAANLNEMPPTTAVVQNR